MKKLGKKLIAETYTLNLALTERIKRYSSILRNIGAGCPMHCKLSFGFPTQTVTVKEVSPKMELQERMRDHRRMPI